jgi:hypothetical protein
MRVISVPGRLRLASALLLLSVPAIAFEIVILMRAPWWKLPLRPMQIWSAIAALITVPIWWWMQTGKRWAMRAAATGLSIWILASAWFAFEAQHPALGFYTLFLVVFFGGLLTWLDRELGRSFFDPQIRWFQHLPKPIPGLVCGLAKASARDGAWESYRVSRIDEEGAFLFRDRAGDSIAPFTARDRLALQFAFRGRQVQAVGVPVRDLRGGWGVGVQFKGLEPDSYKEIGDFVELLRGEGYVA